MCDRLTSWVGNLVSPVLERSKLVRVVLWILRGSVQAGRQVQAGQDPVRRP
jgi:hypothetical protein